MRASMTAISVAGVGRFEGSQKKIDAAADPCLDVTHFPNHSKMSEHYPYSDDTGSDDGSSDNGSAHEYDAEAEAGLMDYRGEEIIVEKREGKLILRLTFSFNEGCESPVPTPHDFEERWCARFSAEDVADDLGICYEDVDIEAARWLEDHVTLELVLACGSNAPSIEEILLDLEYNSLEDGPYEGCAGGNFWVPSQGELTEML